MFIVMVGGKMASPSRPISKTSITTHVEITCIDVYVACTPVGISSLSVLLLLEANYFNGFSNGWVHYTLLVLGKELSLWYRPQLVLLYCIMVQG